MMRKAAASPPRPSFSLDVCGLLQRRNAGGAGLQILRAEAAATADRADELAADDQRDAALRADHPVERQLVDEFRALRQILFKHFGRTAEGRCDPRLVLANGDGRILRIVHLLEIAEVARGASDR